MLDSPASFEGELAALKDIDIVRNLKKAKGVTFSLAFVTTQAQVDALAPAIARKTEGDAIIWFAYPKGSSKKYKSQINPDNGWKALGREGFEPVRMVAIDEDWSAVHLELAVVPKVKICPRTRAKTTLCPGAAGKPQRNVETVGLRDRRGRKRSC
ncbi:MAG TPA: hypothetical protein VKV74_02870 [Bryobacteraceae bacterium]|nr:hypothetical protein [Bryobacteraceae bacterium]